MLASVTAASGSLASSTASGTTESDLEKDQKEDNDEVQSGLSTQVEQVADNNGALTIVGGDYVRGTACTPQSANGDDGKVLWADMTAEDLNYHEQKMDLENTSTELDVESASKDEVKDISGGWKWCVLVSSESECGDERPEVASSRECDVTHIQHQRQPAGKHGLGVGIAAKAPASY